MLRLIRSMLVFTAPICFHAIAAAAQGDRPLDAYWYCHSMPDRPVVYVTPSWDARVIHDEIVTEFRKVLGARYKYEGSVSCGGATKAAEANTKAKAAADLEAIIAVWEKAGHKVVRTGWTSAEPPIGGPPVHLAYCVAVVVAKGGSLQQGPYDSYTTRAFNGGNTGVREMQDAFAAFLRSKYDLADTDLRPYCQYVPAESNAETGIKQSHDRAKTSGGKVVETGWTGSK